MGTLVWAYKPLPAAPVPALQNLAAAEMIELDDDALAAQLIASGDVQDWYAESAHTLKFYEPAPPAPPPPEGARRVKAAK
jgi:hypothetical protein